MALNYNIEPALETALVSLLSAQGIPAYSSLGTDNLSTPRVDVQFVLGTERSVMPENGVSNTYEGQFAVSVITDRDRNNNDHSSFRATVRQILAESTSSQWEAALGSSFKLLSLDHAGTVHSLEQERTLDVSVMTYSAVVRLMG
jgi:hypothetical protein